LASLGETAAALEQLREAFLLNEGARNGRGLEIVTPLLAGLLRRIGRNAEAEDIIARAKAVSPQAGAAVRLTGSIKSKVDREERGYGFIICDDGSPDIYFAENQIGHAPYGTLYKGARVAFDIRKVSGGKRVARNIELL
jgi:cold shock CspA family protein